MIKWIHQNKRSVTVFLIAGAVVLSMSFFKVDLGATREKRYAIKIGDDHISFEQFEQDKKERQNNLRAQYKRIPGISQRDIERVVQGITSQQIADSLIAQHLIIKEAQRLKLYVGEEEVRDYIKKDMPGGVFNPQLYAMFLNSRGQSSRGFEEELRSNLLIDDYNKLLTDVSMPSRRETQHFVTQQETTYDANFIEFAPSDYEKNVNVSDDAVLEKFYNSRQTDFEIPAQATYTYLVFDPERNTNLVEVSQEDIELYYSDNESNYSIPEAVRARQILITIPKDADDKKKEETLKKAEEAHAKATAGEDFESLVTQYSYDPATASKGGDLGWLSKGSSDKAFDSAVFKIKGPGIAELIKSDTIYRIVKVEEYKAQGTKKLEEVRSQIEAEIRKREAPAYTSAKAQEIYQNFLKSDKTLFDYAKELNLSVGTTSKPLSAEEDPDPSLKTISKQVLGSFGQKKQVIEIGDKSVLVQVDKFEESRIPPFAEAKEKIISAYRKEESKKLSKEAAEKTFQDIKAGKLVDLKVAADQNKLKLQEQKALSRKMPGSGPFASKDVESSVFATFTANNKPTQVFTVSGKQYLVAVSKINSPKPEDLAAKIDTYKDQALQRNAGLLVQANLNRLKAEAEIDIDPSLMKQEVEEE